MTPFVSILVLVALVVFVGGLVLEVCESAAHRHRALLAERGERR